MIGRWVLRGAVDDCAVDGFMHGWDRACGRSFFLIGSWAKSPFI